jgi:glycosyltransferase involved in cell wall biosynthesis
VEAAADGGVLIATGIEGILDAVAQSETGFLVTEKNPTAWLREFERIAKWTPEERRAFIISAGEKLEAMFSWERVARQTLHVYSEGAGLDPHAATTDTGLSRQ